MTYNKLIIERKLREFLEEDCTFRDVSSEFISKDEFVTARIMAKSDGYISGLEELGILYEMLGVSLTFFKEDGELIKKGDLIVELNGDTNQILLGERTGLNLLMLMSAITTTTRRFVEIMEKSGVKVKIAGTRKTTPGLRIFEKKAVELGGGDPHRFSLDDMILLKDTHLKYYDGNVKELLEDIRQKASFSKKIEIEIEKLKDVIIAAENRADIIMLDNMTAAQVKEAIEMLNNKELRDKVIIEVSGGITLKNLSAYIDAKPDVISTSELTLFPSEKVDLSLRFS